MFKTIEYLWTKSNRYIGICYEEKPGKGFVSVWKYKLPTNTGYFDKQNLGLVSNLYFQPVLDIMYQDQSGI